jgi:hypothetical protein
MPLSLAEVAGRYCKVYFVGFEEDGLPISDHVTVIEASSASMSIMPSLMVLTQLFASNFLPTLCGFWLQGSVCGFIYGAKANWNRVGVMDLIIGLDWFGL